MIFILAGLVLALMWGAITGTFTLGNLMLGGGVGFLALWLMRHQITRPTLFRRFRQAVSLTALFLYEMLVSALRVAVLVLSPNMKRHLKPAIIAFPLSVKTDPEIALLANLITLTPGTLSVDVSSDKKTLYVHALSMPDRQKLIDDIANGFEKKIKEVFE
jgi:multicomponent Na+:H+ antiporter subunit E